MSLMLLYYIVLTIICSSTMCEMTTGSPAISFDLFEQEYFPDEYTIEVGGEREHPLVYKIGSRNAISKDKLLSDSIKNGFSRKQFSLLWRQIRMTLFNPEGSKVNTRELDLYYELQKDAVSSERSNFMTTCIPDQDCLLKANNEYTLAKSVFSSYTAEQMLTLRNVVFIHSTILEGSSTGTDILESILRDISSSGLLEEADRVFVINFGLFVPSRLFSMFPTVVFVHGGSDSARFEIPTLQIVHYFSRLSRFVRDKFGVINSGTEIPYRLLYLHTKGVSARSEIVPVRDWRRYMSHFSISNHRKCYTILNSREYDALGVDLIRTPLYPWQDDYEENWHFSGNYWWALVDYVAELPRLSVNRNLKYDAEFWIGSSESARLMSLHNSGISHYKHAYPIEKYATIAVEL